MDNQVNSPSTSSAARESPSPSSSLHNDQLSQGPSAAPESRPFRLGLNRLPIVSDLLTPLTAKHNDNGWTPDAARVVDPLHPRDFEMDPTAGAPEGHRRRRSSLLNGAGDHGSWTKQKRAGRSPHKAQRGILEEEGKLLREERPSDEDSKSTSEDLELDNLSEDGLQDDEETGLTGKDKSKRKRQRRRNTLMDQRVAADVKVTAEVKKEADLNVVKRSIINGVLIGLWYLFSLSISIYNKWMFSPDHLDFHFPLFTTCVHMLVQFSLATIILYFLPQFRPRYDSISNPHNTHMVDSDLTQHEADLKKPLMTRMFYFTRIGPCGMATGLDIGLGNMSLKFITLTFYTMCKSSALAFVLLFAFLFRLETPSWRLVAIIATMTVGVIMMVAGETAFNTMGFILIISAAFFSGFRWGLTQILLLRNPATSNPFSSIFYLAPVMFISLLVLAVPVEGFSALAAGLQVLVHEKGTVMGPLLLLFPGTLAFCMTSAEFALLQRTSVVTLSIAGIFKEVVTIITAGLIFHDTMTPINVSGLFVTIGAIAAYNWIKIRKMREDAQMEVVKQHHPTSGFSSPGSGSGSDADGEDDDWDNEESTYVTTDGDILPRHPNRGEASTAEANRKDNSD